MSMWENCALDGAELNAEVARLEGAPVEVRNGKAIHPDGMWPYEYRYITDWSHGGPLIQREQIFVNPPHDAHVSGGDLSGWIRQNLWTATVSARTRTKPNPLDPLFPPIVGRGSGPTALIACMRAYVDSKTPADETKT
jgi:hypothetical protein